MGPFIRPPKPVGVRDPGVPRRPERVGVRDPGVPRRPEPVGFVGSPVLPRTWHPHRGKSIRAITFLRTKSSADRLSSMKGPARPGRPPPGRCPFPQRCARRPSGGRPPRPRSVCTHPTGLTAPPQERSVMNNQNVTHPAVVLVIRAVLREHGFEHAELYQGVAAVVARILEAIKAAAARSACARGSSSPRAPPRPTPWASRQGPPDGRRARRLRGRRRGGAVPHPRPPARLRGRPGPARSAPPHARQRRAPRAEPRNPRRPRRRHADAGRSPACSASPRTRCARASARCARGTSADSRRPPSSPPTCSTSAPRTTPTKSFEPESR